MCTIIICIQTLITVANEDRLIYSSLEWPWLPDDDDGININKK